MSNKPTPDRLAAWLTLIRGTAELCKDADDKTYREKIERVLKDCKKDLEAK